MNIIQPRSCSVLVAILFCAGFMPMTGCQSASKATTQPSPIFYPAATPPRVTEVTASISPAVVRVDVAQAHYTNGKQELSRGNGSGVIIDQQGHVLTNYHVAGRAVELYVTLANKERVPARLVGDDHWTDLAVIQMDMDIIKAKNIQFSSAELGDSSSLVVGQDVMAFGTPYGLARTVTRGSVSNTDRTFYDERQSASSGEMDIDGYETGEFSNWIQMDVPINPGNSGGPLVDMYGKVVGINTRGGGQNLNFAIPIDTAKPVIAALLKTGTPTQKGHVDRSDLGMDLMWLHNLEQYYSLDVTKGVGVYVNNVDRIGPYADAGGKAQDILLSVNGVATNVRFPEELAPVRDRLAKLPVGVPAQLTVKRTVDHKEEVITLNVTPVPLEGNLGEEKGFTKWGLSVRGVTRPFAIGAHLDQVAGVWVTSEADNQPAERAKVGGGSVIIAVNDQPVKDLASFQALYDQSLKNNDKQVKLEIQNGRNKTSRILEVAKYAPTTEPSDE